MSHSPRGIDELVDEPAVDEVDGKVVEAVELEGDGGFDGRELRLERDVLLGALLMVILWKEFEDRLCSATKSRG